jgi:hypothetical protein
MFPHDDLIRLARDDCRDLVSACRKICHNLVIKDSRTCDVRELIQKMDVLTELVIDLQASLSRGAAHMSLAMCLAHAPNPYIDLATTGIPPDADPNALLDACGGYDTRSHGASVMRNATTKWCFPLKNISKQSLRKKCEAEARPAGSGDGSRYTWNSSKEAEKNKTKSDDEGASSSAKEGEEDDNDDVSYPAKEAEKSEAQDDDEDRTSPAKEK